ncbi:Predicted esterase [Chryseobacterium nakagawai]|uniref:Alpha/beta hydrolase n=1 Tax=Chryseobacterium nakagawai TaxID=1241982 RepID=A0AAD1DQ57_CHRNA|nr:alpha/beta hydrolase [Chryseobacterium nakagawai]AZA90381.1 alpha/beta hydrolase [Chryseobacterium nakagawai]VEH21868.1 Predicted esterase [Chryseobacterium nakagawai]
MKNTFWIIFLFSNLSFGQNKAEVPGVLPTITLWTKMPDSPGPKGREIISSKGSFTNISTSKLIIHQPDEPNGIAVLVISGGGYAHIESGSEGNPTGEWLKSQGITAFELIYRLPGEGWETESVPFQDAQRALRIIRSNAEKYKINPDKIGVLGFSAGGHLAGYISSTFDKVYYPLQDAIDQVSARPDFTAMIYPVVSMLPPNNNTHSFKSLLGKSSDTKDQIKYSVEKQVTVQTPITFLAQSEDDPISSVENSILMYQALKDHKVSAELHLFQSGGHGWGLGKKDTNTGEWTNLFLNWLKINGIYK